MFALTVDNLFTFSCQPWEYIKLIMHLSMLAGRGGRPGKGAGFDEKVYPMNREFDHQNSPGGRGV